MTTELEKAAPSAALEKPTPWAVGRWFGQRANRRALASVVLPGLGQWMQRRPIAAALQFSVVILAALDATSAWGITLAIAARLFSGYEAYGRDDAAPEPETKVEP